MGHFQRLIIFNRSNRSTAGSWKVDMATDGTGFDSCWALNISYKCAFQGARDERLRQGGGREGVSGCVQGIKKNWLRLRESPK